MLTDMGSKLSFVFVALASGACWATSVREIAPAIISSAAAEAVTTTLYVLVAGRSVSRRYQSSDLPRQSLLLVISTETSWVRA
jgi:hypothetical protein